LDSERVILLGFLSQGINEQQYSNVFLSVQWVIQKKIPGKLSKDRRPAWQWSSTYSSFDEGNNGNSGLGDQETHLLESLVILIFMNQWSYTKEDKFLTYELKHFVLNWLYS
jgi:hypothetical protein